eukprot:TRINITY_DN85151_c0_g1_i1.p1 TRINITY_DN85151_c0_g1~~TRINITY_DN85151_c0_g1_i1.p1  ORF type:complete len:111 (+),score=5.06 TRINITY_DN85151_c0_g1_i1:108-440(+)
MGGSWLSLLVTSLDVEVATGRRGSLRLLIQSTVSLFLRKGVGVRGYLHAHFPERVAWTTRLMRRQARCTLHELAVDPCQVRAKVGDAIHPLQEQLLISMIGPFHDMAAAH